MDYVAVGKPVSFMRLASPWGREFDGDQFGGVAGGVGEVQIILACLEGAKVNGTYCRLQPLALLVIQVCLPGGEADVVTTLAIAKCGELPPLIVAA